MRLDDARAFWPRGHTDLLVKAAFHPDTAVAIAAWRRWESDVVSEEVYWPDFRIAAVVGRRLEELGLDTPLASRLTGLRRFFWANAQAKIAAAKPLLDILSKEASPTLLKGVARIADDPVAATERFVTDIDILIRPEAWQRAIDAAVDLGYRNVWEMDSNVVVHRWHTLHHSVAMKRGPHEVDFHQFSLMLNRDAGADVDLWSRTRDGSLGGCRVRLPDPADLLAIVVGHGFTYTPVRTFDWIPDSLSCIHMPGFDWDTFCCAVAKRELAVPASLALTYMRRELDVAIPEAVLDDVCRRVREPFVTELHAYAFHYNSQDERENRAAVKAAMIRSSAAVAQAPAAYPRGELAFSGWQTASWRPERELACTILVPSDFSFGQRLLLEIVITLDCEHTGLVLQAVLMTFDFIKLVFSRWRLDTRAVLGGMPGASRLSVAVDGDLLLSRRIDMLRLAVETPASAEQTQPGPAHLPNAAYRWRSSPASAPEY